jgi:hypothetical protein
MEKYRVFRRSYPTPDRLELIYIGTFEAPAGQVEDLMSKVQDNDPDLERGSHTYSYEAHHLGNASIFAAGFKNERFRLEVQRLTNPDSNLDPSDDTPAN